MKNKLSIFLFGILCALLGFFYFLIPRSIDRTDSTSLIFFLGTIFFLFFISQYFLPNLPKKFLFILGILFRVLTIGVIPALSDDWYRFAWDGYLVSKFYNPYLLTPIEWVNSGFKLPIELLGIYQNMNSSEFMTVYPPLMQLFFAIPFFIGEEDRPWLIYQILLLFVEIGNLYLLGKKVSEKRNFLYWLYVANPLTVIESISQIHPDAILVFFFLLLFQNLSGFTIYCIFLLLVGTKISMLFLFPILWATRPQFGNKLYLVSSFCLGIFFLAIFLFSAQGKSGIGLFLHSFRFNGVMEWIPFSIFSLIEPRLSYLSGLFGFSAFLLFYIRIVLIQSKNLRRKLKQFFFLNYLFMAVNHPWYFLPIFITLSRKDLLLANIVSTLLLFSYTLYAIATPDYSAYYSIFSIVVFLFLLRGKLL